MSQTEMTRHELAALFTARAIEPPTEANQLLMRHLKCKESVHLAGAVSEAMSRYAETNSQCLLVPPELLPPLG
jgi:hypothetical protein